MHKHSHLIGLIHVCSVLPALAIMPAMGAGATDQTDKYNAGKLSNISASFGNDKILNINGDITLNPKFAGYVISANDATVDVSGNNINLSGSTYATMLARSGGDINLTAREDVNITSETDNAIWAYRDKNAKDGGLINITGRNVKIKHTGKVTALLAQNTTTDSTDRLATINIDADNIEIESKDNAIVAMSQGIVNLNGNTKISATNAIQARGNAQVMINKSGQHSTKMNGNIAFGYHGATSGTGVDALVDITFAGADSVWNGNTVALWDTKPADTSKLKVSQTTIALKDGATWNAAKITDADVDKDGSSYVALNNLNIENGTVNIADATRGVWVDNANVADATFNGGPLQINNEMNITGGTNTINTNIVGTGALNVADGATLNIGNNTIQQSSIILDGTMIANLTERDGAIFTTDEFTGGGKLSLIAKNAGDYKLFGNAAFENVNVDSALYNLTFDGTDTVSLTLKSANEIATDNGMNTTTAQTVVNLANSSSDALNNLALSTQEQLALGNTAAVQQAHRAINPDDAPVVQTIASNVQGMVSKLAATRMSLPPIGRAGGDQNMTAGGVWAQGLFNKSKKNGEFNGYTRGIVAGIDGTIDDAFTIGVGYAFNHSDISMTSRDTEIDSSTLFIYGQYKPSKWYINATLNYTMSDYTENGNALGTVVDSDYKIHSFGGQVATGYDFASGVTPEIGLRYLHIGGDDYTNSLGISNKTDNADYLTAIAGLKYGTDVVMSEYLTLRPELRAAAKYDLTSDDYVIAVAMPGVDSYGVRVNSLGRFGTEVGIGITMSYKDIMLSFNYDIEVRKDYTSQTGILRARYNF